jgi:hypothetical protein
LLAAGDAEAGETKAANIEQLPLYPEARACRRPTTEHILRLFSLAERVCVLNGAAVPRDAARDRYPAYGAVACPKHRCRTRLVVLP